MATLKCLCGKELWNGLCPSPINGYLLRDSDMEFDGPLTTGDIVEISIDVWECPKCGRIALGYPKSPKVKWYKPEDGQPGHFLRNK